MIQYVDITCICLHNTHVQHIYQKKNHVINSKTKDLHVTYLYCIIFSTKNKFSLWNQDHKGVQKLKYWNIEIYLIFGGHF